MKEQIQVLIVSFRRPDVLRRCLDSVGTHLPEATVSVWDNASDSSHLIREVADDFPQHIWTFSDENVGFAKAINALSAAAGPGDLLWLNPDAVLAGDLSGCRQALIASHDRHLQLAAAAPLVDDPGGGQPWDNARRAPSVIRAIVSYSGYGRRLRRWPVSDLYPAAPQRAVGYLSGSCLLIRRDAWEDVGPLDEDFFLYAEEADWADRARRRGWFLIQIPEPGVVHSAAGTVGDDRLLSRRSERLLQESNVRYLRKNSGLLSAGAYRVASALLDRVQRSKRNLL